MKRGIFLVLLLALTSYSGTLPKWYAGEVLDYEIAYGFMTAGNARMQVVAKKDSTHLDLITTAWNNGFFENMYKVADTIRTVVQRQGLRPLYLRKSNHEGSYHAATTIVFKKDLGTIHLSDTVFKEPGVIKRSTDTSVSYDGDYHNILSSLYKVRMMYLQPGKSEYLLAVSGKKKYTLKVICHRRETVTVPAGTFPCLVVEPILQGDGIFQTKGSLTIWLSDDARRIPVLMKSKIAVGSIRAELTHWK